MGFILAKHLTTGEGPLELKELQRFQQKHDEAFHPDVMAFDRAKQIEHSTFHLAKLAGIFSTYCEKTHHGEPYSTDTLLERIPDMLVFAMKFANLFQMDLETAYLDRIRGVERRKKL